MKDFFKILFALSCLTIPFFMTGCGEGGTETGNPTDGEFEGGDDGGEEPVGADSGLASQNILDSLCSKLTECFEGLSTTTCENGVEGAGNLDDNLGLEDGIFTTYEEIVDAEEEGTITPNEVNSGICTSEIDALNCSDSTVASAYDEDDPDNFNNVQNMVPSGEGSCEGVY